MKTNRFTKTCSLLVCLALLAGVIGLIPTKAATPLEEFQTSYDEQLTALTSVTDVNGIVTAVTEDTAQEYVDAYAAYQMLEIEDKSQLAATYTEIANKLAAANRRAEIFTKGMFVYDEANDSELKTYFTDSTTGRMTVLTGVDAVPEITYVRQLAESHVGDTRYYPQVDFAIGSISGQFYTDAQRDTTTDKVVAERRDNQGTPAWGPGDSFVAATIGGMYQAYAALQKDEDNCTFGEYVENVYQPYDMTTTLKFTEGNGTSYTLESTYTNGYEWNDSQTLRDAFAIEDVENSIQFNYGDAFVLKSVSVTYPSIQAELKNKYATEFVADYPLMKDIEDGKYDTVEELLEDVNRETAEDIYTAITTMEMELAKLDPDLQELIKGSALYNAANVEALKLRAGIFATGEFHYDIAANPAVKSYFTDSTTGRMTILTGVDAVPELTYVRKLRDDYTNYTDGFEGIDILVGTNTAKNGGEAGYYIVATETKNDVVYAANPTVEWAKGYHGNYFFNSSGQMQTYNNYEYYGDYYEFGKITDSVFEAYALTTKILFVKSESDTTYAIRATFETSTGDENGGNTASWFSEENVLNNISLQADGPLYLQSVSAVYPSIQAELKNKYAEEFLNKYPLLQEIKDGDYDTAEEIVTAVNAETAEQFYTTIETMETELAQLDSDLQELIKSSVIYSEENIKALKLRAAIFTTGEFSYSAKSEPELKQFFTDADGWITILTDVGAIPEITYTRQLAEASIGNTRMTDQVDVEIGKHEYDWSRSKFYVDAQRQGDIVVAERRDQQGDPGWGASGACIANTMGGTYNTLISFQNATQSVKCIFGDYTSGSYQPYDITSTLTFNKQGTNYGIAMTLTNNHDYSTQGTQGAAFKEDWVLNGIRVFYGTAFVLTDLQVNYPSIKAELNDKHAEGFVEKYQLLKDIRDDKYDTVEEIVAAVNSKTANGIYSEIEIIEADFATLDPEMQTIISESSIYSAANMEAIKLRAGIFVNGEFSYDLTENPKSLEFMLDSDGWIAILTDVGAIPEITYVRQLAESYIGWTRMTDQFDLEIGKHEYGWSRSKIYVDAQLQGNVVVAERRDQQGDPGWGASGACMSTDMGGVVNAFIQFQNDDQKCIFGEYVDGDYQAYNLTNTISFFEQNEEYGFVSEFSNEHGYTNIGRHGTSFTADWVINGIKFFGGSIFELKSITVTYPQIKAVDTLATPDVLGATIKLVQDLPAQNLRFNASFTDVETEGFKPVAYGFVMMATDELVDAEGNPIALTMDTKGLKSDKVTPVSPVKSTIYVEEEAGVPERFYISAVGSQLVSGYADTAALDREYSARAYVIYENTLSGQEYVVYSKNDIPDKVNAGVTSRSVSSVLKSISTAINNNTTVSPDGTWISNGEPSVDVSLSYGDSSFTKEQIQSIIMKSEAYIDDEQTMLLYFALNNRAILTK